MAPTWYYARGDQQIGPVSVDEIIQQITGGNLLVTDQVWTEGMTEWKPAQTIPLFADTFAALQQKLWPVTAAAPAAMGPGSVLNYHTPEVAFEYAGFWIRFAAIFLDGLILGVASFVFHLLLFTAAGMSYTDSLLDQASAPPAARFMNFIVSLINMVVGWIYFASQESSKYQATLGKRACGIIVTDLGGAPITFGRATGRYFAKIISYITLLIGFMLAGWTEQKQALHDMIASTFVIKGRAPAIREQR